MLMDIPYRIIHQFTPSAAIQKPPSIDLAYSDRTFIAQGDCKQRNAFREFQATLLGDAESRRHLASKKYQDSICL
jgi:hypothetical protein